MNINTGYMVGSQQSTVVVNNITGGNGITNVNQPAMNRDEKMLSENLSYKPRSIIGRGSDGTRVFEGTFSGRNVAVKRLEIENVDMGEREADLLLLGDEHENIVKLYCTKETDEFYWIVMEKCEHNLGNFFQNNTLQEQFKLKDILKQITAGISHLHAKGILHRDIKPQNILIKKSNDTWMAKISDFGISKILVGDSTCASMTIGNLVTHVWTAPESIVSKICSKESDIYSLACVFYFMLTQGNFPDNGTITPSHFGSIESADENLAVDLIEKMLRMNPTERPSAEQILSHAFFWDSKKILATFANIIKDSEGKTDADMIKISVIKNALNDNSALVIYGNWQTKVDAPFTDDLKVKRNQKLKGDCVFDLIKYIRNKYTHLKDQTFELQALLGENDDDFLKYWTTKFPKIIVHTYIQLLNIPI